jgi:hypothetical protein
MRIGVSVCLLLLTSPIVSYGEVWNLTNDFSITQNPNGAWSYGWREASTDPFVIYVSTGIICHGTPAQYDQWWYDVESWTPGLAHNPKLYPVGCDDWILQPGQCMFHPGPAQQSVVRWTAPASLEATLSAHFASIAHGSETVHVYYNGVERYSAFLSSFGQTADYSTTIAFQPGDVIDCAIDTNAFYSNSTQVEVALTTGGSPIGACCFANGACLQGTQADCQSLGGSYVGEGVPCDPDPCGPTPVKNTTWGQVKALYR